MKANKPEAAPEATYDRDADRAGLLAALLPHVEFEGWSETALAQTGADCGLAAARIANAFPGGMTEVLIYWHDRVDAELAEIVAAADFAGMKVPQRIAFALNRRFAIVAPHREAVRAGLVFLSLPGRWPLALRLGYRSVDTIWRAIGDPSVDFNFYTKRASLAAIYLASLFYWLEDESAGQEATGDFIDRRLRDLMTLGKAKARLTDRTAACFGDWRRSWSGLRGSRWRGFPFAADQDRGNKRV